MLLILTIGGELKLVVEFPDIIFYGWCEVQLRVWNQFKFVCLKKWKIFEKRGGNVVVIFTIIFVVGGKNFT